MEQEFAHMYHDYKQAAKTFQLMNNELTDLIWNVNCAYAAEMITKFQYVKLMTRIYVRLMWINVIHD